jgi:hypothetical protein
VEAHHLINLVIIIMIYVAMANCFSPNSCVMCYRIAALCVGVSFHHLLSTIRKQFGPWPSAIRRHVGPWPLAVCYVRALGRCANKSPPKKHTCELRGNLVQKPWVRPTFCPPATCHFSTLLPTITPPTHTTAAAWADSSTEEEVLLAPGGGWLSTAE